MSQSNDITVLNVFYNKFPNSISYFNFIIFSMYNLFYEHERNEANI